LQPALQINSGIYNRNVRFFKLFKKILIPFILLIYLFFCYLQFKILLQYIPYNTDTAFLRIKQDIIDYPFYKLAFFTHVYTTIFLLPAGFIQFSSYVRRKFKILHKANGWVYAAIVILLAGPAGFYMGIFAKGGLIAQSAFCLLAVFWIYFTLMAINKAINRDFISHRKYLIRSFSLTLSAITLRAWKYLIVLYFDPRPLDVYKIAAWLSWIPNLIIAELIIHKYYSGIKQGNKLNLK